MLDRITTLWNKFSPFAFRFTGMLGATVISLPIIFLAYYGQYARYLADDFATSVTLQTQGFWQMQEYWYMHWSGRFSFFFLTAFLETLGPETVPFLPGFILFGLVISFSIGIYYALRSSFDFSSMTIAVSLGAMIVAFSFAHSPNLIHVLYWQTGLVTYVVPVMVFSCYLALLGRNVLSTKSEHPLKFIILASFIPFVSGGFSESFVVVQTGILVFQLILGVLILPKSKHRTHLQWTGSGLFTTFLAAGIILMSPGNAIRQASMLPHAGIADTLRGSFSLTYHFLIDTFSKHTIDSIFIIFWPALLVYWVVNLRGLKNHPEMDRVVGGMILILPGLAFSLIMACYAPPFYAFSSAPPDRVLVINHFLYNLFLVCTGVLLGVLIRINFTVTKPLSTSFVLIVTVGLVAFLFLSPVRTLLHVISSGSELQKFAVEWDARDTAILSAKNKGINEIEVRTLTNLAGLDDVGPNRENWWNQTIADYYGVEWIWAEE